MTDRQIDLLFHSPEETARHAEALGAELNLGDVILLEGDIGAGKTHFARALIQSILTTAEDVPSPTFTLVQTYDAVPGTVWHADLYRITSTHEIEELGLAEAFETAICIVEWPDRLAEITPPSALRLSFSMTLDPETRSLLAEWQDPMWDSKMRVWPA